jgi:hypothetical protein
LGLLWDYNSSLSSLLLLLFLLLGNPLGNVDIGEFLEI